MHKLRRKTLPPNNPRTLAKLWSQFVDIERRAKKEIPFILGNLQKKSPAVFDSALGCGATTIGLKQHEIHNVTSNEIDLEMRKIAEKEAKRRRLTLKITAHDWRSLPQSMEGGFDLVTCLGNSLTYLFDRGEQLKALRNFRMILSDSGVMIIDERNYPRILEGRFVQSGENVFCGVDRIRCEPVLISEEKVAMGYTNLVTGEFGYIESYPLKRGELHGLLAEAGFMDIEVFGDYKKSYDPDNVEFFTYIARKQR